MEHLRKFDPLIESASYESPRSEWWTGRAVSEQASIHYWYQAVECTSLTTLKSVQRNSFGIIGYACDEGVRRNEGRIGAADGPNSIRTQLASLAWHHADTNIQDFGNILCPDGIMENSQQLLTDVIQWMRLNGIHPLVLGGGHDVAFGHGRGLLDTSQGQNSKKLGIINFDAHFDLRKPHTLSNSGTPFYQLCQTFRDQISYAVVGIQRASNTASLYETASKLGVLWIEKEDMSYAESMQHIRAFTESSDELYISIDIDGCSSAYAPGVSAPSPLGFTPEELLKYLKELCSTGKVISVDIAEMNPRYDVDAHTARLSARIIDQVVRYQTPYLKSYKL